MKRPIVLRDDEGPVALQVGARGLPIVDQFSEEGFVDNVLKIGRVSRERGRFAFRLGGWFGGSEVGFDCRVRRGIKAGFGRRMQIDHVYPAAVEVLRSGPESDRFLRSLAKRYGLRASVGVHMARLVSFTGIALHQGPIDVERRALKIKLFGGDDPKEHPANYNESFFNLDLANGLVFWNEKDPEYRCAPSRAVEALKLGRPRNP